MKKQHADIAKWIGIAITILGIIVKISMWAGNVNTQLENINKKLDRLDPEYGPPSR